MTPLQMLDSIPSYAGSAPCRIDWRPSRAFAIVLCVLGVLAALSLLASEVPRALAWSLAPVAVGEGMRLARGTWRLPARALVWPPDDAPTLDGLVLLEPVLHWRGPCAFLRWRDEEGRTQRLTWWPDVLSATARRELRLAALGSPAAGPVASMAP